jgi:hypothetical protein
MRILLDENEPTDFGNALDGHEVSHVILLSWAGTKNGQLLKRAEEHGFHALITPDKGFEYQQNLIDRRIAVIVIRPRSQGLAALLPYVNEVLGILDGLNLGTVYRLPSKNS